VIVRFSLVLSVAVFMLSCKGGKGSQAAGEQPAFVVEDGKLVVPENSPLRTRLVSEPAQRETVRSELTAPAVVEPDPSRVARITPPLAGRVTHLFVRLGALVQKGQPLLALDAPDYSAAQSDLLRAQAQLQQAERNQARQKDLADHGIAARRDLEQAETDRATAQAEVARARARLHQLGGAASGMGKPMLIRSPVSGRVIELAVAQGEYKNDPNAALMTVGDLSTVWLTASVQEKDVGRVGVGADAEASFAAYPGESFKGQVLFVGDVLDPDTRTVKVRVALPNPGGRFKPGMFATVTFAGTPSPRVTVPTTALLLDGDRTYVFVAVQPFVFERRVVVPGEQVGNRTIIARGLEEGTRVVTRDAVLLQ
jgi:cobalt-zinc-cadmium efflux system membrane fusion protein